MLAPLLAGFRFDEAEAFFESYLAARGDAGHDIFNYIFHNDRWGWKWAFDRGDHATAIERLELAVRRFDDRSEESPELANVLSSLGVCYSHAGRHDAAKGSLERAIAIGRRHGLPTTLPSFNLGQCLFRSGDMLAAAKIFEDVVRRESEHPTDAVLLAAARQMLAR